MKGVILAGGKGTRLYPLTYATNKHLLPVYDQPMVYYPIQTLQNAGIDEILIVTGESHAGDFINVIKNGKDLGLKHVEYAYQEGGSAGISDALKYSEDFADGGSIAVILGDNTTDANIKSAVERFVSGAKVFRGTNVHVVLHVGYRLYYIAIEAVVNAGIARKRIKDVNTGELVRVSKFRQ